MATANISVFVKTSCMALICFDLPRIHQVAIATAYMLLSVVTILSNAVFLYTLFKTKQFNTISSKLIMIMSISDICLGAIAFPIIGFRHMQRIVFKSCALDKAASFITLFLAYFSFLMLCCISIDRYLKVMKMDNYTSYMNDKRINVMVVTSIFVATIISFVSLMYPSFPQHVVTATVGSFFITFAMVMHVVLLRRLRNHMMQFNKLRRIRSNVNAILANTGTDTLGSTMEVTNATALNRPTENWSYQLSATKTIKFLLIFLAISCAPYHFISCWWTYYKFLKKVDTDFLLTLIYAWAIFVALFNASGNSWIIIFGNKRSRRFLSSLLWKNRIFNVVED